MKRLMAILISTALILIAARCEEENATLGDKDETCILDQCDARKAIVVELIGVVPKMHLYRDKPIMTYISQKFHF